jgi:hypothetical protein
MHPRQSWLALGLLFAFSVHSAVIYRWVDADGVVHYSDQASPGAEKIVTATSSTGSAVGARSSAGPSPQMPQQAAQKGLNYNDFTISAPVPDQSFFGEDVVAVHLTLSPSLRPNQAITWHLNGKQLETPPDEVSFALPRLDRGTYVLTASITDQQTGESQNSNSVTFFVRQPTSLAPQSPLRK